MPLPKIATPTYELELPSTGKTIQYRPFLVKEEKLLVIALESEDTKQITTAIKAVLKSCVLTKGIKVDHLPTFDIEYLFLNIRGKSVGEEVDVNIIAPDDGVTEIPVQINLDDIQVQKSEEHTNEIVLDDSLRMEMKYPSLSEFINSNFDFNEEEVWAAGDCTKKEIKDFLEQMNSKQFKEIERFFETMPKLSHTIKVTNPATKVKSEVVLEGLSSFFA